MARLKCAECFAEDMSVLISIKRQVEDNNGEIKVINETWCLNCLFKEMIDTYNETQKELRAEARDLRFMTDGDKKLYAFQPPTFRNGDEDDEDDE